MKKAEIKERRALYRSMLPHGGQAEVARRLKINRAGVSQYLSGKTQSEKIENAVLDYIAEYKAAKNDRLRKAGLL